MVFVLSACFPGGISFPQHILRDCVSKIVTEGATKNAFSSCITTAGLTLTESLLKKLEKDLLKLDEPAFDRVTNTLLDSEFQLDGPFEKEEVASLLVQEIKEISGQ